MMSERFDHELVFHCPDVDENARCSLRFMRTLRIPDDGQCYPLPPGLGRFQLSPVVDESARSVPEAWRRRGGVMMPMYQAEAMWISFETVLHPEHALEWPFAIQVATGRINAVSGKPWQPGQPLVHRPQDYVVIPGQPWLDGFCVQKGRIRQFVAMTLGEGHTAEEQLTGVAEHGGLQITAIPMKREPYLALVREAAERRAREREIWGSAGGGPVECMSMGMGMAPGGLMIQDIYQSEHDPEVWDQAQAVHACVHVLNSEQWHAVTGRPMPRPPVTARAYADAGLPWFDCYDEHRKPIEGSQILAGLDSVAASIHKASGSLPDNDPVVPASVIVLKPGQH